MSQIWSYLCVRYQYANRVSVILDLVLAHHRVTVRCLVEVIPYVRRVMLETDSIDTFTFTRFIIILRVRG